MPAQHIAEYGPPVIRSASPASSIGTTYGRDQTSLSDQEIVIAEDAFEQKWKERIGLTSPRKEELEACQSPLFTYPPKGSVEESQLHERILHNLREHVKQIVEDEVFEEALLKGSQVGLEQQCTTTDIDSIMRSMMPAYNPGLLTQKDPYHDQPDISMNLSMNLQTKRATRIQDGPWNYYDSRYAANLNVGTSYHTETTVGSAAGGKRRGSTEGEQRKT